MEFVCIADRCKHSCCIGWEIDIDDDTFRMYQEIPGTFGEYVRSRIATEEDGTHHFILGEDERCPFLNEQNLCELILNLGEDALCDICSEHPRFYVESEDGFHMGYGLCCEEAGRILLFGQDGDAAAGDVLGNGMRRTLDICDKLSGFPGFLTEEKWLLFLQMLLGLEMLGMEWPCRLSSFAVALRENRVEECFKKRDSLYHEFLREPLAHLYEYLMLRYGDEAYAGLIWQLIFALCVVEEREKGGITPGDVVEICRLYSSEIEYCEENVEAIKAKLQNYSFDPLETL